MHTPFKFGAALIANEHYFSLVGKVRVPGKTLTGTVVNRREVVKGGEGRGWRSVTMGLTLTGTFPNPRGVCATCVCHCMQFRDQKL